MKYSFGLAWTMACALTLYPSIPVFAEVTEYGLTPEQQAQAALQQNQFLQAQWAQAQYMQQQQQMAYQTQMQAQAQAQAAQTKAQAENQAAQAAAEAAKPHVPSDYELQEQAIQKGLAENKTPKMHKEDYTPPADQRWYPDSSSSGMASTTSKARKTAGVAGKVIARGAAVALPTVGFILLSRAMTRGTMMDSR